MTWQVRGQWGKVKRNEEKGTEEREKHLATGPSKWLAMGQREGSQQGLAEVSSLGGCARTAPLENRAIGWKSKVLTDATALSPHHPVDTSLTSASLILAHVPSVWAMPASLQVLEHARPAPAFKPLCWDTLCWIPAEPSPLSIPYLCSNVTPQWGPSKTVIHAFQLLSRVPKVPYPAPFFFFFIVLTTF